MWTLVFVWMLDGEPVVRKVGTYNKMYECFYEFDNIYNSMPPKSRVGTRLVCVYGDTNEVYSTDRAR